MTRASTALLFSSLALHLGCSDRNATVPEATGTSGGQPETEGSASSAPGESSGDALETSTGPVTTCGDGIVDPGEDCDDGNDEDADGCNLDCTESGSQLWEYEFLAGFEGRRVAVGPDDRIHVLGLEGTQLVHVLLNPDGVVAEINVIDVAVEVPSGATEVDRIIDGFGLSLEGGLVFSLTNAFFDEGQFVSVEYQLHSLEPAWVQTRTEGGPYVFDVAADGRIVGMRDGFFDLSPGGDAIVTGEYVNAYLVAPLAAGAVFASKDVTGFDGNGNITWTSTWPSGKLTGLQGLAQMPGGDVIAIGQAGENLLEASQLRLARYTSDGSEVSTWLWPDEPEDAGTAYDALAVTAEGHIAFAAGNNLVWPPDGTGESYLWKLNEDYTTRWRVDFPADAVIRQMRADSTGALVFLLDDGVAKFAR